MTVVNPLIFNPTYKHIIKCGDEIKHDSVIFSLTSLILTHQTEVPRCPRSEKGEGGASLQWRSTGKKTACTMK